MKKLPCLFAAVFAVLAAASLQFAAGQAAPPPPDVSGTWNLTVAFTGGTGNPVFTFKQDGEKLTGHYQGALGEAEVTGTITGSAIKFGFKVGGTDDTVTYSGTVDGDAMKGSVNLGQFGDGTFTGKRVTTK